MPSIKSAGNAFGAFNSVKNFVNVVREVDFEDVRQRAERLPSIIVVAQTDEDAQEAAERIFGERPQRHVEIRALAPGEELATQRYDIIVVHDPAQAHLLERVRAQAGTDSTAKIFYLPASLPGGMLPEDQVRTEIAVSLPDLAPAIGRFIPTFRVAAARAIMDETAKANAQFALVSNIPAAIPLFGNLLAASADLIVLTKNQIMMCYKLAALHGRDLHDQTQIFTELAPVVGAGFLWRTLAREGAALLPFAAGTVPKVAIAYGGTLAVGWSADFYFRYGKKPTRAQLSEFSKRANQLARSLPFLQDGKADASATPSASTTPTTPIPLPTTDDAPTEPLPPVS